MRILLLMLLLPLMADAQISFGPVRLDDSTALSYSIPGIVADSGALMCHWAAICDSSISACARRASANGDTLTEVLLYDSADRTGQTCPPELTIVHTQSGGEARLIYHSCNGTIVVRFLSAGGQITDSLHRGRVMYPVLSRLDQGLLLAYVDFILNQELLVWLQDDGTILREDTVDVPVEFAYTEGMLAKLVAFSMNWQSMSQTFFVVTFHPDGTYGGVDTLLVDTLQSGEMDADHVFNFEQGALTIAAPVVQQSASPLVYRVRVIRYVDDAVTVFTPWNTAAIPAGSYIQNWSLADGPVGSGVIGYYVRDSVTVSELRFEAFDAAGQASEVHHTIPISFAPTDVSVTGLSVAVLNETVYPLFTLSAVDSGSRGGVSLAAFPLNELLPAGNRPHIVPQRFSLTAYPNPFNSAVRLEYEVSRAAPVSLRVFDITGRLVGERRELAGASGQGTILWSMDGLPSGVYLARLSSGKLQTAARLYLIR